MAVVRRLVTQAEFVTLYNRGEQLLQAGRAAQAERVFRDLLGKLGDAPSYQRAVTLGSLGRCLQRARPAGRGGGDVPAGT